MARLTRINTRIYEICLARLLYSHVLGAIQHHGIPVHFPRNLLIVPVLKLSAEVRLVAENTADFPSTAPPFHFARAIYSQRRFFWAILPRLDRVSSSPVHLNRAAKLKQGLAVRSIEEPRRTRSHCQPLRKFISASLYT